MYNRYIRSEEGAYVRVPEEEPVRRQPEPPQESPVPPRAPSQQPPPPPFPAGAPPDGAAAGGDGLLRTLRRVLDHLHLESVDTGDLLLLAVLFLLFEEEADEELLFALGLLLIL